MGLKCRLLGHAYGEPEVERDREEQGDEVVVTIREVQACERCGDEQVVSQNKEVTAIRSPEDVGLDESAPTQSDQAAPDDPGASAANVSGTDAPATGEAAPSTAAATSPADGADADRAEEGPTASAAQDAGSPMNQIDEAEADAHGSGVESGADAVAEDGETVEADGTADGWETGSDEWDDVEADPDADDAVILDDAETERDETQWPEETETDPSRAAQESAAAEQGEPVDDDPDEEEVTNDAEIIDGDPAQSEHEDSDERGHGEWPERDEGSDAWPEHESDDEGYAATPGNDAEVDLSGNGLTPEVNGHATPEGAETVDGVAVEEGRGAVASQQQRTPASADPGEDGFTRARESTTLESDVPDEQVEFYCPNCGHSRTAGASSMRAGDICPECKKGYIAERER
jgi:predicted RNA-binding Zn-ribbon protein involved in translation (DUF1610 family)